MKMNPWKGKLNENNTILIVGILLTLFTVSSFSQATEGPTTSTSISTSTIELTETTSSTTIEEQSSTFTSTVSTSQSNDPASTTVDSSSGGSTTNSVSELPNSSSTTTLAPSSSENSVSTSPNVTTLASTITTDNVDKSTENGENNPTTESQPIKVSTSGPPTWALVLIALMLSFSGIFTGLFFLRKYLVKKRKEERRYLLSARSQEGFFFGDQLNGNDNAL